MKFERESERERDDQSIDREARQRESIERQERERDD